MYSKNDVNQLLEILLPQDFDSVIKSIQDALREIDPSWKKNQFKSFSRHFKYHFWRSIFTKRFLLNDTRSAVLHKTQILETILRFSQNMTDMEKVTFYGDVLSEYVLYFPTARFPAWAESYKEKPNWLANWHLHSTAWHMIYW
jgi:hypothetical protein